MIQRTFQLLRGVGPSREKDLWCQGIHSWEAFLASREILLSAKLDEKARINLGEAKKSFEARDLRALAHIFPPREHWRLYSEFSRDAAFFDIETDGGFIQTPTVVSLFHAKGFEVFVHGKNLDALPAALARWPFWVTFNGSCFDVPVLKAYFEDFPTPALHLDLRFFCHKLGLRGGLKKIEETLGFPRPPHLCGVNGLDAIVLWQEFKKMGDSKALRTLIEYNLYDSIQLRTLAEIAFNRAVESLGFENERIAIFDRGDVLYDVSQYLLECMD